VNLRPALGNYASGDRFWDREREVREIVGYLAYGQGVLLTGPRRVGKTSVVRAVLAALPEPMAGVFVDAEQYGDPTELFAGIAAAAAADAGFWGRLRQSSNPSCTAPA
jgi:MoxR-like ATPase